MATSNGYVVINDGSDDPSRKRVFYLDTKCKVDKEVRYPVTGRSTPRTSRSARTARPLDRRHRRQRGEEDAPGAGGGLDDAAERLEAAGAAPAQLPGKEPHDAEALLVGDDNMPLVITKDLSGKSEIFTPTVKLKASGDTEPIPMKKVGEVTLPRPVPRTGTVGQGVCWSPAPPARPTAARSYCARTPTRSSSTWPAATSSRRSPPASPGHPLADPFGEAISYTPDGKLFVTVSDGGTLDESDPIDILSYTPSTTGAEALPNGGKAETRRPPRSPGSKGSRSTRSRT
ncbi:hypothetical protein V2I01_23910 [Micromonospora sp. BRA006-A]|nr:hypothetical protein [Micromonospora sp. BRA006-A]